MFHVYNWYKLSNILYKHKIPFIPKVITYFIRLIFGAFIPSSASIGKGTNIDYGGIGVVIHSRSVIGKGCIINTCVTIGGTSNKYNVPVIGDNVVIGSGAKILGPIKIGNNVVIGANAVVVNDIPDNVIVGGIPAKIIKENIDISDYK